MLETTLNKNRMYNRQKIFKTVALFSSAVLFFILDRVVKNITLNTPQIFKLGDNFLSIRLVKNYYIAFSIQVKGVFLEIFIALVILVMIVFLFKLIKRKDLCSSYFITLVILGALSNLIDRIYFGFVVDYIDILSFPVFNIADSMIFCGAMLFIIYDFKNS